MLCNDLCRPGSELCAGGLLLKERLWKQSKRSQRLFRALITPDIAAVRSEFFVALFSNFNKPVLNAFQSDRIRDSAFPGTDRGKCRTGGLIMCFEKAFVGF